MKINLSKILTSDYYDDTTTCRISFDVPDGTPIGIGWYLHHGNIYEQLKHITVNTDTGTLDCEAEPWEFSCWDERLAQARDSYRQNGWQVSQPNSTLNPTNQRPEAPRSTTVLEPSHTMVQ